MPSSNGENVQNRCTGVFSAFVKGKLKVRASINSSHADYYFSSAEPIGCCSGRPVESPIVAAKIAWY